MSLRVGPGLEARLQGLEPEVRSSPTTIGGIARPGARPARAGAGPFATASGDPEAVLVALELDREPEPDGLTLTACLAAHRAYVDGRRRPEGVSLGALALSRLLGWASRASLLAARCRR